jgi:fructokinase
VLEDDGPLTPERLTAMCRFANAAGALATTKRGAIPGLPTRAEVDELVRTNTAPKTSEVA